MADNKLANPGPIGLMGFGMTTMLLNIHNAGLTPLDGHILGMGLFVGGLAQIIAGIFEFKKGNTFASLAFTMYGSFWITLVYLLVYSPIKATPGTLGTFLLIWGLFTAYMFVCTFKMSKTHVFIFGTLLILFALLVVDNYLKAAGAVEAGKLVGRIAGFEGIICGASAFYLAMAEVVNEVFGKERIPIGFFKKDKAEP